MNNEVVMLKEAPIMCRYFLSIKGCNKQGSCRYAHTKNPCIWFNSPSGCFNGTKCQYPHVKFNKCMYGPCEQLTNSFYCNKCCQIGNVDETNHYDAQW
jgi:hypothetical protein